MKLVHLVQTIDCMDRVVNQTIKSIDFDSWNQKKNIDKLDAMFNNALKNGASILSVGKYFYVVVKNGQLNIFAIVYDDNSMLDAGIKISEFVPKRNTQCWLPYPYQYGDGDGFVAAYKYLVLIRDADNRVCTVKIADYGETEEGLTGFCELREGNCVAKHHIPDVIGYIPLSYYEEDGCDFHKKTKEIKM